MTNETIRQLPSLTILRFVAVVGILFNHWSGSLLHFPKPVFSALIYDQAAKSALTVLFTSSGFLIHWNYRQKIRFGNGWALSASEFLLKRLSVIVPIAFFCIFVDLFASNFISATNMYASLRALPYFATLSQAWFYSIEGSKTLTFPFAASNLTWLGSSLFFLYLLYPILGPIATKARSIKLIALFGTLLFLGHFFYLNYLVSHYEQINIYAAANFGDLASPANGPAAYSFFYWLGLYSPYGRIPEFAIGICLAEAVTLSLSEARYRLGINIRSIIILLVAASAPVTFAIRAGTVALLPSYDLFAAASLLFCVAIDYWSAPRFYSTHPWFLTMCSSSFVIWNWHLIWFNAYPLPEGMPTDAWGISLGIGRFVAINLFVLFTSVGLLMIIQRPAIEWIRGKLDLD
jgi:peptidoglycan/LPS O-acetylase OafA/YrhL